MQSSTISAADLTPPLILADSVQAEHPYINVPLIARDQLIGSLNLGAVAGAKFTHEHLDIAHEVAGPMALAIHQARLYEQVQRHAAELERRVAERTAKLEEINAELKSFTFSVSHDLRAPLRAVQGFAQAMIEDCGDQLDPLGRDYALRICAAAERMDILVQELLVYSRLSRADLRLQPIDLAVIMADVLTQLEISLSEQQAQVVVEQPLAHVLAHYATLAHVISNLITNAVKFVHPGTTPHIRLWTEIVHRDDEPGEWVRLWVEDNGIGIAPENLDRIFQIFERLHGIEAYPGSGIGLAMVRKGVNRMGGYVGVESQLGHGSRFWLELPKAL
jgi:signal transduction histidine kinase